MGFFWATVGRGVERCVWEQAAWSEWATPDGHAVATGLPLRHLQLEVQQCQGARHVKLDGVAGEQLRVQRGVTPGRAFATTTSLQQLLVVPFLSFEQRCRSLGAARRAGVED